MKKYELTEETKVVLGVTLHRIKALIDIEKHNVKAGDLGGYVEKEDNLDQSGNAWVYGNAWVHGDADYATIKGFGTVFRTTTFFRCKDKLVRVKCGCFYGTIDEFRKQVNDKRSGKVAEEYLMIADLMEKHFEQE